MAHINQLNVKCQESGCKKIAEWELIGRTNAKYGRYCKKHADRRLNSLLETEKKYSAAELGA